MAALIFSKDEYENEQLKNYLSRKNYNYVEYSAEHQNLIYIFHKSEDNNYYQIENRILCIVLGEVFDLEEEKNIIEIRAMSIEQNLMLK